MSYHLSIKCHSLCKKGKAIIWFKQTQLWGLDCSPKARSLILTLNRLRNMSFQPLCVCARVVNCFHVFDRWLGVPRSEANILLNKQWGKRREEEWGVGENTGCHLYFYLCKCWIFLKYCICGRLRIGEKMELWGFIYEESSKRRLLNLPPETERLVITLICTDIMGSHAVEQMELLGL